MIIRINPENLILEKQWLGQWKSVLCPVGNSGMQECTILCAKCNDGIQSFFDRLTGEPKGQQRVITLSCGSGERTVIPMEEPIIRPALNMPGQMPV